MQQQQHQQHQQQQNEIFLLDIPDFDPNDNINFFEVLQV